MALAAGCGGRDATLSDWEVANKERLSRDAAAREVVQDFPAYPRESGLLDFTVPDTGGFRFSIDRGSLAVTAEGVVRYALVMRSSAGVESASYEGLRCASGEVRVYALGRAGAWQPATGAWRPVAQRWHAVLAREYFCPQAVPIRNAAEGVLALEQGGHPFSKGFSAEPFRR